MKTLLNTFHHMNYRGKLVLLPAICLLFPLLLAFQPDPERENLKKELAALHKHYENLDKLRIRYEMRAYNKETDAKPMETIQMEMERIGKLYYLNNSVMEQINTPKGQVLLDHANKLITVSPADTFSYRKLFAQFREIVQPDSFFNRYVAAFKVVPLSDGQKKIHVDYKNAAYKYIEITYHPATKVLGKIRICYLEDPTGLSKGSQPTVDIILHSDFNPQPDAGRYDISRYVNRKGDQWTATSAYKTYRVLN